MKDMRKFLTALLICGTFLLTAGVSAPGSAPPPPSEEGSDIQWGDQPSGTLPDFLQYGRDRNIDTDLSIPHRTKLEIQFWAAETAANVLSFGVNDIHEHMEDIKKYFVQSGWDEFNAFASGTRLIDRVIERRYRLISVVSGPAAVLPRDGPVGGIYRWEVEVPMLLSFYPTDAYGRPLGEDPSATTRMVLILAVSRTPTRSQDVGSNDFHAAISGWRTQTQQQQRRRGSRP
ncbi:MAG: hypothetical protein EA357_02930 [Micavibrio sp.]|nr:MAG: hypothetical protein EA357_02930 [Micavibrio sp.]